MKTEQTIISYQNTFGVEPWGAGRVVNHPGVATVANIAITGAGLVFGWPIALIASAVTLNDLLSAKANNEPGPVRDVLRFSSAPTTRSLPAARSSNREIAESPRPITVSAVQAKTEQEPTTEDPAIQTAQTALRSRPEATPIGSQFSSNPWQGTVNTQKPKSAEPPVVEISADHQKVLDNSEPMQLEPWQIKGLANELLIEEDGFLRSWMIFGVTGGGKGTFVAFAVLLFMRKYPDAAIYAIDPKADPKEYKRWAMIPAENRIHYNASRPDLGGQQKKRIQESIRLLLDKYENDPAPIKLLISDEQPTNVQVMGKYGKDLKDYLNRKAGMGRSRGHVVWSTSNQLGLRENKMTAGERDNYQLIYLTSKRKLRPINDCRSFPGPTITADDAVFSATGRAGWASTADRWVSVSTSYRDAVEGLPDVVPPAGFGEGGTMRHLDSVLSVRDLAEQIAENLQDLGKSKAKLSDLIEGTDLEGTNPDDWNAILPALHTRPEIEIKTRSGNLWVSFPRVEEAGTESSLFFD